ncbi:MAG: TetR/AcrR family transcriptional regulator [Actinobacteria bacterium]|jgi:AcrR family transcriptional regulator|nr:MAG: TetR/AcrR family transcriptional regulator [Actinomycetota bacterium]
MTNNEARRKKRLPASERKKVILDAALSTFVEFGYHGALMDTIAERAEVTKPILYRHFPSKLDLLLAILDQTGEELRDALLLPNPDEMDWHTSIRHSIKAYFGFVANSENGFRLIYATDLNVDRRVIERITEIRNGIIDIVANLVGSYTNGTIVSAQEIRILAILLVGMVESTVVHWLNNKDVEDIPYGIYEDNLIRATASILSRIPPRSR